MRARRYIIAAATAIVLVTAGTAAGATIASGPVDSSGVIHGCWTNTAIHGSHAFVLQDAGTTCPRGTTAISWNQQGLPGPNVLVYGEVSVNSLGANGCAFSFGPFGPGASSLTVSLDGANRTCVLKGVPASFMPATLPADAVVSPAGDEITFPIINFPGVYDFALLLPES